MKIPRRRKFRKRKNNLKVVSEILKKEFDYEN
jgi:hypothetical protein